MIPLPKRLGSHRARAAAGWTALDASGPGGSGHRPVFGQDAWQPSAPARAQAYPCVARQTVPVIAQTEVLVIGSSFQACFLAARLARSGRRVVLTSADTSLPHEIAIALRPWIEPGQLADAPADMRSFLEACKRDCGDGPWRLDMVAVTTGLEDRLLDAGAGLYYDLQPCGVQRAGRNVTAVVFAGKGSLVAIEARVVVDATPDARVAKWAGAGFEPRASAAAGMVARYSMLCAHPPAGPSLPVDGVPELVDGRVLVHADFVEFAARLPAAPGGAADAYPTWFHQSWCGWKMRRIATAAGRVLRESGAWPEAEFVRGGDALLCDPLERLRGRGGRGAWSIDACRPAEIDNLLVASPAADVDDAVAQALVEPVGEFSLADVLLDAPWQDGCRARQNAWENPRQDQGRAQQNADCARQIAPQNADCAPQNAQQSQWGAQQGQWGAQQDSATEMRLSGAVAGQVEVERAAGEARFHEVPPLYHTGRSLAIGGLPLPVASECEVLVVGGGTSGTPAGILAAAAGVDTLLVEKHGDLGGTQTIGGVPKYWFGHRTEFVQQLDRDATAMMEQTAMPRCMGMLDTLIQAGAGLLRAPAAGTVLRGNQVAGVVFATPDGLAVITARHVIDATGDGDIAAWAGAAADYGTRRDAMTMWDSFAHFRGTNPEAARHFDCAFDRRDPADLTRGIISSRRRGAGRDAGGFPQYYLTARESRHIRGRATVTYEGILARRRFRDVVLVALSNFDIKGIACSDLIFSGYVDWGYSRNHPAAIPYRSLVPQDLEGILVIGKAYSCTHDALSLARMQRDMIAMGGVAGLAAAQAVQTRRALAAIDVDQLQADLIEIGILTRADIESDRLKVRVTDWQNGGSVLGGRPGPPVADQQWPVMFEADVQHRVQRMAAGERRIEHLADLLVRPEAALPVLREALPSAHGAGKIEIARMLCYLNDTAGAETLLGELHRDLAGDELPEWEHRRHAMPDHGWAPPAAYLIFLLARLGDRRVIAYMHTVAAKIRMNPDRSDAMFCYAHALCLAAEHLSHADCIAALEILADKPGINAADLPLRTDPRRTVDPTADRYAYLELCTGRALLRCGSPRGREILRRYARDLRGVLARSAQAA